MKILISLLSVIVFAILLISCGKDDPKPTIIGEWVTNGNTIDVKIDGQSLKDFLIGFGLTADEAQHTIDSISAGGPSLIGSFTFKDGGVFKGAYQSDTTYNTTGTWKLSDDGKTLTITDNAAPNDPPTVATVQSLTTSELILNFKVDTEDIGDDGGDDGFGFPLEFDLTVKFKRP